MSGKLTIQVILIGGGVYGDYYPNNSWTAPVTKSNYTSTLSIVWGSGDVIPGYPDFVTAKYYITLRGNNV